VPDLFHPETKWLLGERKGSSNFRQVGFQSMGWCPSLFLRADSIIS
jgi:hypothetical protein